MDVRNAQTSANDRLTGKERRRRLWLLGLLATLLLLATALTAYFLANRALPGIDVLAPERTVAPPNYVLSITGSGKEAIRRPTGVAVAANNDVYVVDFDKRRVSVFTRTGRFKFGFSKIADGKSTALGSPINVAIANDEVFVTDRRNRAIYIFGLDGAYKRKFVPEGLGDVWTPLALDVTSDGELRVTDVGRTDSHRILLLDEAGEDRKAVGESAQVNAPTDEPGKFYFPAGIAVARDGRIIVSDGDNRRVQVFDRTGRFKYFIDTSGVPRGVAIDRNGAKDVTKDRLYVVDALAHVVSVYSLDGEAITDFGSQGFGPGQFNYPNDIAVGPDKRLYVTDRENNQVQVWEWPVRPVTGPLADAMRNWWPLLLLPLLLLPLLLLGRKKRFVVTPDFVDGLVAAERVQLLTDRKSLFIAPEFDKDRYKGRTEGGVDLGEVIRIEPYSPTDAQVFRERYASNEAQAAYLAMGDRARALLTDDTDLTVMAMKAEIRVMDTRFFGA